MSNFSNLDSVVNAPASVLLLINKALIEGKKDWVFAIFRHLPARQTTSALFELIIAYCELAKKPAVEKPLMEYSNEELLEFQMLQALRRKEDNALDILLSVLQARFAACFPTRQDALPFPAPQPADGEYEAIWAEAARDQNAANSIVDEHFETPAATISAHLEQATNAVWELSTQDLAGFDEWLRTLVTIYSRAWPFTSGTEFIKDVLRSCKNTYVLSGVLDYTYNSDHSRELIPVLEELLGLKAGELTSAPDWYHDEQKEVEPRDYYLEILFEIIDLDPEE